MVRRTSTSTSKKVKVETKGSKPIKTNSNTNTNNNCPPVETLPLPTAAFELQKFKYLVLARLQNQKPPYKIINLDTPLYQFQDLLSKTLINQESNSCVLVGPTGSGKSLVLSTTLQKFKQQYKFQTIYLNCKVFDSDKLAILSLATQLQLSIDIEEDIEEDTEPTQAVNNNNSNLPKLSFSQALDLVLTKLKSLTTTCILILDGLDILIQSSLNQPLVYNLLDTVQHTKLNPLFIVGTSTHLNFSLLLEKRVKSRFSNRILLCGYMPSFKLFDELLFQNFLSRKDPSFDKSVMKVRKDPIVQNILNEMFQLNKNPTLTMDLLHLAIQTNPEPTTLFTVESIQKAYHQLFYTSDPQQLLFDNFSNLELGLLIAAKHITLNKSTNTVENLYNTYTRFSNRQSGQLGNQLNALKSVAQKALDRLSDLDLITLDSKYLLDPDIAKFQLNIAIDMLQLYILKVKGLPSPIKHWLHNDIM